MINAQFDLYIVSFYPNQINVLIDNNTGWVPSCNVVIDTSVDYQLYHLLRQYAKDIPEKHANFRLVNIDIINDKLVISYLIMVSSTPNTKSYNQGKYVSIETLLNENTHSIIQKIKNII